MKPPVAILAAGILATTAYTLASALLTGGVAPSTTISSSSTVLDRNGRLLRAFTVEDGRWRLAANVEDVDPQYVRMLLAFEDRRFHEHGGVDHLALARAAAQLVTNGRIVSGGSTLTMQVARLLDGDPTRDPSGKLRQILRAMALERDHDKQEILRTYLNLAPFGGNIEGVRAATLAWFGKEPARLTPAQAALLVALPQSPEARRPDRDTAAAERARNRVLDRAVAAGVLDTDEARAARMEPVPTRRRAFPLLAAHAARRAVRARPDLQVQRLTIDAGLQERLERLAAERARTLGAHISAAILVADLRNGEVVASVGSAGLLEQNREGFIDMTRAVRSPGSTLKPLIYGIAFEDGIAHPESLIEDRPAGFAGYEPTNFDREFHGTVTLRHALQRSLNVPAVKLLERVGPVRLIARMRRAGVRPELSEISPPGLAIGLGGVGLRLKDLVAVYGAIARGGRPLVLTETLAAPSGSQRPTPEQRVLDERASWYVSNVLGGAPAPQATSPDGLAFKTGTSYGYRDAWAIGFDGRNVAGVWVGRPDGAPVPGLTGIDAAVPILVDTFARLETREPLPGPPPGVLFARNRELPPPLRHVGGLPEAPGTGAPPEISFPPEGARLALAPERDAALTLKLRDGSPPFTWFANGAPVAREPHARTARWQPDGPGFATISVVDAAGRSSRVRVFLDLEPEP
jgi:penicillin-binding protein 1C